ncbi:MAG: hypothetical protein OXS35_03470, partial [Dehalococcoidia bacterium]|nr:hypothetical protein [Dehalococcoidia bacterium]
MDNDIASELEAVFKLHGPQKAIEAATWWRPRSVRYRVADTLAHRLIAEGHADSCLAALPMLRTDAPTYLTVANALALAGVSLDANQFGAMLARIHLGRWLDEKGASTARGASSALVLDATLLACEILTGLQTQSAIVDEKLAAFLAWEGRRIDRLSPHDNFILDLVFRAYSLNEERAGRQADVSGVFLPRDPAPKDRPLPPYEQEREDTLQRIATTMLPVYSTVGRLLVQHHTNADVLLQAAQVTFEQSAQSRVIRRVPYPPLRTDAAANVTVLLAAGYDRNVVMRSAMAFHGAKRVESDVVDRVVTQRLSLWLELHGALLQELSARAQATRAKRIGAKQKSDTLLDYARMMLPLSSSDAHACFKMAVEAAKDLDYEAIQQICAIDELVTAANPGQMNDAEATSRDFANFVSDAAIRLDYDDFPWGEAMHALARLNTPLALACAARWDVEGRASLWKLLPQLLEGGLDVDALDPEQVAGLACLDDGTGQPLARAVEKSLTRGEPNLTLIAEEAARFAVTHGDQCPQISAAIKRSGATGHWSRLLLREDEFTKELVVHSSSNQTDAWPKPDSEPRPP